MNEWYSPTQWTTQNKNKIPKDKNNWNLTINGDEQRWIRRIDKQYKYDNESNNAKNTWSSSSLWNFFALNVFYFFLSFFKRYSPKIRPRRFPPKIFPLFLLCAFFEKRVRFFVYFQRAPFFYSPYNPSHVFQSDLFLVWVYFILPCPSQSAHAYTKKHTEKNIGRPS